ncbi:peptidoglycan-binding domain-containing protein [Paracoccus chinensis]|uniref:Peptidoglycan-binding (PGRP) domain of peptidoglycan hydrolases-containing protein n=1 Tax=Paracoccus chinensis TaxID=525640 RepID=A0A1G9M5B9_9RHOB|nr:peptidoglycan-binding protein [Paracoccus chinensis]SDL69492.1 Peptidoglycan-binding (PGRP) domain of peptidoglycan hydrolases-containing protein [Paracoccus chinensis]
MVGNGMTGRFAALVAAGIALGAPLGAAAQQPPVVVPGGAVPSAEDEALWSVAQAQGTAEAYRNYLTRFPAGAHVPEARARLGQLLAGSQPVVTGPPAAPAATPPAASSAAPPATPAAPAVTPPPAPTPVTSTPLTPATEVPPAQSPAQAARAEVQAAEGAGTEATLNLSPEDRRAIQSRLTVLGHDTRGVDGVFGSGTRRAIRDWQTSRGYAPSGYLTSAQAAELRTGTPAPAPATPAPSAPATGATAASEAALELTATQKRIIQSRLNLLGHDTRGIDGAFGSGTRRAITAWQQANNLPATGFLTRADADTLMNAGTTPPGRPVSDAETAARDELALNLTREDRVAVQQALVQAGHDTRGVDGTFGSGTRRAIRDWQTARNEAATGYLTGAQYSALRGGTSTPAAPAVPVVTPGPGATAEEEARLALDAIGRTEVQSRLSALGYDPNGIDGRFGSGTRRAISAWQGDNGLAATGYLNADQLARLRAQRRN